MKHRIDPAKGNVLMKTARALNDRISAHSGKLSPSLRRAADFVTRHPDEVATRSLRYLAGMADLSPPTFSRLATRLGYACYEELRESCRTQIKTQRLRFAEGADMLQKRVPEGSARDRFIFRQGAAAVENINLLLGSVDLRSLDAAASRLACARRVFLAGSMSSRPFVDYMAYMATMAFDNWQVLGVEPGSLGAALVDVNDEDAAVVIAKAPYAGRSIDVARVLCERNAWVIGITDEVMSPLPVHCVASFIVSTRTPQFFSSHVATLVLIESLIGMIVANGGEGVRDRIAAVESTSHAIGEYRSGTGVQVTTNKEDL